ncbi:hypothetical protein ACVMHZ_003549 [Bradyrhizobium liaoningense]
MTLRPRPVPELPHLGNQSHEGGEVLPSGQADAIAFDDPGGIGVVSGEPHLLQPIQMLEISRKGCPAHSAREQAFVGHLLRPLSALRLNARNLTLRAAM